MIDILAQAATGNIWETIGVVVGAAALTIGGREGIAHVKQRKNSTSNSNGGYNKALCEERHHHLEQRQSDFKEQVEKLDTKLDKLGDGIYKRLNEIQADVRRRAR